VLEDKFPRFQISLQPQQYPSNLSNTRYEALLQELVGINTFSQRLFDNRSNQILICARYGVTSLKE
jgi:hypothetical protein